MQSFRIATVLVAVLLGAGLSSAQSLLVSQGQPIAFSGLDGTIDGDLAPGLTMGERFGGPNGPNPAVIDDSGRMLFRAQLVTSAGANYSGAQGHLGRGYWLGDSRGNLVKVLRGGDPEPSGTIPGATLQTSTGGSTLMGTPRMSSSNGLIMFGTAIWGGGATSLNDSVIYGGTPSSWQIVAREGSAAPGCGGATYFTDFSGLTLNGSSLNSAGNIVFQSSLAGTGVVTGPSGNDAAWFSGSIGNVQLMLRKGDLGPGLEQVSAIGNSTQMNASGQVLTEVTYVIGSGTNPVTVMNDKALWVHTPGPGNVEILREGTPSPIPGTLYGSPSLSGNSIFNAAGQAVVGVDLTGAVNPGIDNNALFLVSQSGSTVVMRKGDAAPGVGANFLTVSTFNMCLNDGGTVAFGASLIGGGVTPTNDSGLWIGTAGNLTLVAREGDVAPGSGGQTFLSLTGGTLHLNAAGQLLFANALSGGGNAQSWYSFDPVLGLQAVFFPNDSVEVQPGVFRSLVQVAAAPNSNGDARSMCFANDGTVTLRTAFSDGSWGISTVRIGSLTGIPRKISEATGGTQKLYMQAGSAHAGQLYIVAGSASGTMPGVPIGSFILPLNPDAYTEFTLNAANLGPYVNTVGLLNANGGALAQIVVPPLPGLAGLLLHHAYGVLDAFNNLVFVSEPAPFEIVP